LCRRKAVAHYLAGGITLGRRNLAVMICVDAIEAAEAGIDELRPGNGLVAIGREIGAVHHAAGHPSVRTPVTAMFTGTALATGWAGGIEFRFADRAIFVGVEPGKEMVTHLRAHFGALGLALFRRDGAVAIGVGCIETLFEL
jgi:hypothetical protein